MACLKEDSHQVLLNDLAYADVACTISGDQAELRQCGFEQQNDKDIRCYATLWIADDMCGVFRVFVLQDAVIILVPALLNGINT